MDVKELIADLKGQGLEEDKILEALQQMVEEGKLTPEQFEEAKKVLELETQAEEKEQAQDLFGLKFNE